MILTNWEWKTTIASIRLPVVIQKPFQLEFFRLRKYIRIHVDAPDVWYHLQMLNAEIHYIQTTRSNHRCRSMPGMPSCERINSSRFTEYQNMVVYCIHINEFALNIPRFQLVWTVHWPQSRSWSHDDQTEESGSSSGATLGRRHPHWVNLFCRPWMVSLSPGTTESISFWRDSWILGLFAKTTSAQRMDATIVSDPPVIRSRTMYRRSSWSYSGPALVNKHLHETVLSGSLYGFSHLLFDQIEPQLVHFTCSSDLLPVGWQKSCHRNEVKIHGEVFHEQLRISGKSLKPIIGRIVSLSKEDAQHHICYVFTEHTSWIESSTFLFLYFLNEMFEFVQDPQLHAVVFPESKLLQNRKNQCMADFVVLVERFTEDAWNNILSTYMILWSFTRLRLANKQLQDNTESSTYSSEIG